MLGILPKEKIHNLYVPEVSGKERRKTAPSKEGYLGVEGIDADILRDLLSPFEKKDISSDTKRKITSLDLFEDGFTGTENSSEKRNWLKKRLNLPLNISTSALIDT